MAHESARPYGCDPGCGWTCEDHRFINSVILETVQQIQDKHNDKAVDAPVYAPSPEALAQLKADYAKLGLILRDPQTFKSSGEPIPEFAARINRELGIQPAWVCECLDCGWRGLDIQLMAQACPLCDGRVAETESAT